MALAAQAEKWDRISLEEQLHLAALSQVPIRLSLQVSPSLAQIFLVNRGDSFLANGFIVRYGGTNWVALSYHVGGKTGTERLVKIVLRDGTEVSFDGVVEASGNAGYHEADLSLIRIPEKWQDEVTPLEIAAPVADLPIYSFGSVANASRHHDFLPVKRTILDQTDLSLRMTHNMPGEKSDYPAGISGYCGSPLVQEIDGELRVVGIYTGHINAVSAEEPAVSFGVDLSQALPVIVENPTRPRTLKFLGKTVGEIPFNQRLESVGLVRISPEFEEESLVVRDLYHYPNRFSLEHAEQVFFDLELRSGDALAFKIKGPEGYYFLDYKIP